MDDALAGEPAPTSPPERASSRPAIELRVHGVSGTPPESLLGRALVAQVAGDRIAGFYRPRLPTEDVDDAPTVFAPKRPGAPRLMGYSWGGLTSGSAGRAFWLLLLPFTLINIAPRARPPHRGRGDAALTWLIWALCRAIALLLTALFVLAAVGVGQDLVGWQCPGSEACAKATPAGVFDRAFVKHELAPEHTLLLGALVPLALLCLLWLVSNRTANRYEKTSVDLAAQTVDTTGQMDQSDANRVEIGLGSRLMWKNEDQVRRLRATHMQTGFAVVLWSVIQPTQRPWGDASGRPDGVLAVLWFQFHTHLAAALPVLVIVYGFATLCIGSYTGREPSTLWRALSGVVWVALIGTASWEVVGLIWRDGWVHDSFTRATESGRRPTGGLPYYAPTVLVELAALGILLAALIIVVLVAACTRDRRPPRLPHLPLRPGLLGMETAGFAALAVFLAAAFSAGIYTYAATWLRTGSIKPGFGDVGTVYQYFVIPEAVRAASLAYAWSVICFLILVVVYAIVFGIGFWLSIGLIPSGAVERDYGDTSGVRERKTRVKSIKHAIYLGRLVDCIPFMIAPVLLAGLVIIGRYGVPAFTDHRDDSLVAGGEPAGILAPDSLRGAGAYLAVITLVGLVGLGVLAFRTPALRKTVGILWDVASFWPRASHPLAAPCYAERTVPDLITYITAYRAEPDDGPLILAAHSQGTVISAAALMQLHAFDEAAGKDDRVLHGVGFLSVGCVLRRLYGRYFPVYFGPERLCELQDILGGDEPRWRNLWRYTDYLGGQVTAGPGPVVPPGNLPAPSEELLLQPPVRGPAPWEWHSADPARFDRPDGDTAWPAAHRHSDFWSDESGYFQLAAADLIRQMGGAPTPAPHVTAADGTPTDL